MGDTLFGIKIITSEHIRPVPVLQIHPSYDGCTDKFRAEMDAWLLEKFGEKHVGYMLNSDTLVLHPTMLREAKRNLSNFGFSVGI